MNGQPAMRQFDRDGRREVVLPTPPFPISITRPWPSAAMPSTSSDRLGARSSIGAPSAASKCGGVSTSK